MKLKIVKSHLKNKKYDAILDDRVIPFGASGYEDYTQHHSKIRRNAYISRHSKNEDWTSINAGSLSRYILWGDSTDINENIKNYKIHFHLS